MTHNNNFIFDDYFFEFHDLSVINSRTKHHNAFWFFYFPPIYFATLLTLNWQQTKGGNEPHSQIRRKEFVANYKCIKPNCSIPLYSKISSQYKSRILIPDVRKMFSSVRVNHIHLGITLHVDRLTKLLPILSWQHDRIPITRHEEDRLTQSNDFTRDAKLINNNLRHTLIVREYRT